LPLLLLPVPVILGSFREKLEWPASLSGSEPFIVLRGDDGRMYYADVMAAQRYVQGPLTAGTPTALLGLESIKPHEIIAVALGSGDRRYGARISEKGALDLSAATGGSAKEVVKARVHRTPGKLLCGSPLGDLNR
jgi:hypothetical protein